MSEAVLEGIRIVDEVKKSSGENEKAWGAYLGTFWTDTVIQGKTVAEWSKHFRLTPHKDGVPLTELTPKQLNEYSTLLLRRLHEAGSWYSRISAGVETFEADLEAKVKTKVAEKVAYYRDQGTRCPARDTLITTAKGELVKQYSVLKRGKMEVAFFDNIVSMLKGMVQVLQIIATANAHEIKLAEY